MTNTLTRLLLTAALCGLFLLSEAQERNAVSAPDPAAPRMPADSISRDYRLDGVVIGTQRPPSPLGSIAEGRFRLLMRNSSALPRFAGSIDPMRILQLMPGVQTAAEGNSGLYVRGNDAGQNLILLNQAPLYAHAHLLGFFSVFNPGQVASFELSKTGGGRIETAMQPATVVVQSREETGVRWGVEGDLGIIASQATVTAPLTDRAALFLSGRRSYTGWLIGALSPKGEDDLNYRLQDYDATLAWQIDDHNKLIVNSHYGDDRTHITYNEGLLGGRLQWYASVSSATLRSELSPTTHMENALYYSRLDTRLTASTTGISAQAPSSIGDLGYKHSTRWHIGRLQLAAGLQYAYRRIRPQHIASDYGGIADAGRGPRYDTHELAPFLAATIPLTHSLTCDAALRYGFYLLQGDGRIASYRHASPQPSLSLDWQVARGSRLRASYNYITQYIHKVPSSNISFSTDFWMAPTRRTPPQHTHHAALGYFAEAAGGRLNFSAEAYYQRMYRVLEYNAPLTGMVNNRYELEQYLHSGDGEAYGMEFMVSSPVGNSTDGSATRWGNRCVNSPPSTTDCPSPLRSTGGTTSRLRRVTCRANAGSCRRSSSTLRAAPIPRRATSTSPAVRSSADTAPTTAPACRITTGSTCRSPTGCGGNRGAAASISPSSTSTPTATRSTSRGRCSSTKRSTNTRSIRAGITSTPSSPP